MTQQHTPGPWIIEDPTGPDISILARCDQPEKYRRYIAHLTIELDDPNDIPADEVMANARLIAYAPDMLAMLKRIYGRQLSTADWADIRATIAKVQGKQP